VEALERFQKTLAAFAFEPLLSEAGRIILTLPPNTVGLVFVVPHLRGRVWKIRRTA
jgi:hypothetical protein